MKLQELGEFGLIARLAEGSMVDPGRVIVGIGDDCAVTPAGQNRVRLLTTDLLVERVHFLRAAITPWQLGFKSMTVNLSDIAAMGGRALDALVSIALPAEITVDFIDNVYGGMCEAARRYGVNIVGGDTTTSKQDLIINVAITGEAEQERLLLRSGGQAGDRLFVTGYLGDSAAGLDAILNSRSTESHATKELVRRHHEPEPHLAAGQAMAATGLAHALIDLSDGLSQDLGHICERSLVGCEVDGLALPVSTELMVYCDAHGLNPLTMALAGGEDYVLLVAGEAALGQAIMPAGVVLTEIGQLTQGSERTLSRPGGRVDPLPPGGWNHFSQAEKE